jgi:hypothetical protein
LIGRPGEDFAERVSKVVAVGKVATITGIVGTLATIAGVAAAIFASDIHDHFYPPAKNELKSVTSELNQFLNEASTGRVNISDVNKAVNNCHTDTNPLKEAKEVHDRVTTNRGFLLTEVSDIEPIEDSDARALEIAFKVAFTQSLRADQDYEAWLRTWKRADGCMPLHSTPEWAVFNEHNDSATTAKRFFLRLYNESARKYHLPQRSVTGI